SKKLDAVSINLTHVIKNSQWIAAVVYCDNGAVAHTTPVYFVVDGKPTYDRAKAPQIIQKQLVFIEEIGKQERAKKIVDAGILDRLDKAGLFYKNLLAEINRAN
ncbi:MAG: hypothetical protein LH615_16210, partial [Ferruginibacter sp.]|nr:hypothetical protein [Ferruginibacter sp.]